MWWKKIKMAQDESKQILGTLVDVRRSRWCFIDKARSCSWKPNLTGSTSDLLIVASRSASGQKAWPAMGSSNDDGVTKWWWLILLEEYGLQTVRLCDDRTKAMWPWWRFDADDSSDLRRRWWQQCKRGWEEGNEALQGQTNVDEAKLTTS